MTATINNPVEARTRLASILVVVLIAVACWLPSLRNEFAWDDRHLIVENELLTRSDAVALAFSQDFWESAEQVGASDYYRPLVTLSYILDRRLHGLDPTGYHLTNLVLHLALAIALVVLLLDLGIPTDLAILGAGLFACHPAHTETVAWISGRTDLMAACFLVLALWADRRRTWHTGTLPPINERPDRLHRHARPLWRVFGLVMFTCALLSKEISVVLPVVAVVLAVNGRRASDWWRAALARWDLFAVLILYLAIRGLVLSENGSGLWPAIASPGGLAAGWDVRLLAVLHLPGVLLAPVLARMYYGESLPASVLLPGAIIGLALVVWLVITARRRTTQPTLRISASEGPADGPALLPKLILAGAVALVMALPALLFKSVVAERLLFLPAVFVLPAIPLALRRWTGQRATALCLLVCIVAGGLFSVHRTQFWISDLTVFRKAATESYPSANVQLNLAIALHDAGLLAESYDTVLEANQRYRFKQGHYLLGLLHTEVGCPNRALAAYGEALTIDPDFGQAANNLAVTLAELGRPAAAAEILHAAADRGLRPASELQTNLQRLRNPEPGTAVAGIAPNHEQSIGCETPADFRRFLTDARYLNRRAYEKLKTRQLDQAGVLIRAALHVEPDLVAARLNLAQWHVLREEIAAARAVLTEILDHEPDNQAARNLASYIRDNLAKL